MVQIGLGGVRDPGGEWGWASKAGSEGPAVGLVNDYERAGGAVLAVAVDRQWRGQGQPDPTNVVECECVGGPPAGHRSSLEVEVEGSLDGFHDCLGDRRSVLYEHPSANHEVTFGQPT